MKPSREAVELALVQGANPRGFTGEMREIYLEMLKEAEEANAKPAKKKK